MSCGHRELFSNIAAATTMPSDSNAGKNNYNYIDVRNKGVCYPSEYKLRSELSGKEPCTSYRFQNPAYNKNQIFLGDGSSTNPLSLVQFSNGKTLEDAIMSKVVKDKVVGLLTEQSKIYDTITNHNKQFIENLKKARSLNTDLEQVEPYNVKKVDNIVIKGVNSTQIPNISPPNTEPPCSNDQCKYKQFEYSTKKYGPIGNAVALFAVTTPPRTANSAEAMFISRVQSPTPIQFNDTCPLSV